MNFIFWVNVVYFFLRTTFKRCSKSTINKVEYIVANLVPNAVHRFCLNMGNICFLRLYLLAIASLFSLLPKCFQIKATPSLCERLGYRPTTSIVHRIPFFGKLPNSLSFFKK